MGSLRSLKSDAKHTVLRDVSGEIWREVLSEYLSSQVTKYFPGVFLQVTKETSSIFNPYKEFLEIRWSVPDDSKTTLDDIAFFINRTVSYFAFVLQLELQVDRIFRNIIHVRLIWVR
jgi:hypothetical protein